MPSYEFQCKKCEVVYTDLASFDATGKYKDTKCPACGSKKKSQLMTCCAVAFTNPRDTSKWDNFSYRAGKTMDEAQGTRRAAEAASHMGTDPYGGAAQIAADINNDKNYGKVK